MLKIIEKCKQEYLAEYRPMYEQLIREKEKLQAMKVNEKFGDLSIKEKDVIVDEKEQWMSLLQINVVVSWIYSVNHEYWKPSWMSFECPLGVSERVRTFNWKPGNKSIHAVENDTALLIGSSIKAT